MKYTNHSMNLPGKGQYANGVEKKYPGLARTSGSAAGHAR